MGSLEGIQYQAALAMTGTRKGTNRNTIYEEIVLETLLLLNMMINLTPTYLYLRNRTSLNLPLSIPTKSCRTDLDPAVRNTPSISIFKKLILELFTF